jgi:glycerol-3-phosphate dehydrogenase
VEYADGQFDDARYNLALVHTFAEAGGRGLNHCRVTDFHRDSGGRLSGLVAVDQLTGATLNLNARAMVNATGPVSDLIRQMATPSVSKRMRLSKGSHILFPLDLFPTDDAMLIPKTEAGSVLFAVPWGGRLLVGTTEREVAPGDDLYVAEEEVTYMLRQLNKYLTKPLQPSDIVSGFAGARPLVSAGDGGGTQRIARDDVIEIDAKSGLISIMGGKWTTHRAMAEDTINAVQKALGVAVSESLTRAHVLHGGEGFTSDLWEKLIRMYRVSKETAHHLAAKFGAAAWSVLELTRTNSSLAQPLIPGSAQIQAEVVYAVREELAAKIEDVVSRRIGLQYYSWRDAIKAAPVVGSLMAQELQWTSAQEREAVNRYVDRVNLFLQGAGLEAEPNPPSRSSAA